MLNKVMLIGNVGADPEIRTLESGTKTARVRLATTMRRFDKEKNDWVDQTDWHTINLWRGLADVVDRFVRKGSQIYVEGSIHTREYTDKDNVKRYSTEITAADLKLLGKKQDSQSQFPSGEQAQPQYAPKPQPQQAAPSPSVPEEGPDDLPF